MCAVMSGERAVIDALRDAGIEPDGGQLGAASWFFVWDRAGLDAIAERQPEGDVARELGKIKVSEAVELARLDRRVGITGALMSGRRSSAHCAER
jgi:hypothetical protein